jgi:hypothetical protein
MTTKNTKNSKKPQPAVASSDLLAVPSARLELEMLRRAVERGNAQIMAAELTLAALERKQSARRAELATQIAKLPANDKLSHGPANKPKP